MRYGPLSDPIPASGTIGGGHAGRAGGAENSMFSHSLYLKLIHLPISPFIAFFVLPPYYTYVIIKLKQCMDMAM